jgi:hypothetical protein
MLTFKIRRNLSASGQYLRTTQARLRIFRSEDEIALFGAINHQENQRFPGVSRIQTFITHRLVHHVFPCRPGGGMPEDPMSPHRRFPENSIPFEAKAGGPFRRGAHLRGVLAAKADKSLALDQNPAVSYYGAAYCRLPYSWQEGVLLPWVCRSYRVITWSRPESERKPIPFQDSSGGCKGAVVCQEMSVF